MVRTPIIGEMTVARRGHHANDAKVDSVVSNRVVTAAAMGRDATLVTAATVLLVDSSSGSVRKAVPIPVLVGLPLPRVDLVHPTLARVPEIVRTPVIARTADRRIAPILVPIVLTSVHAIRRPADGKSPGNRSD